MGFGDKLASIEHSSAAVIRRSLRRSRKTCLTASQRRRRLGRNNVAFGLPLNDAAKPQPVAQSPRACELFM